MVSLYFKMPTDAEFEKKKKKEGGELHVYDMQFILVVLSLGRGKGVFREKFFCICFCIIVNKYFI